ncbi:hypothetical protein TNCV_3025521 [Trichonephila clavipes]|nr:hypothetical protein TNCV_3025521 [Trichonephila clavipes]
METARQNLQPEQSVELKQEPALITDPNFDKGLNQKGNNLHCWLQINVFGNIFSFDELVSSNKDVNIKYWEQECKTHFLHYRF